MTFVPIVVLIGLVVVAFVVLKRRAGQATTSIGPTGRASGLKFVVAMAVVVGVLVVLIVGVISYNHSEVSSRPPAAPDNQDVVCSDFGDAKGLGDAGIDGDVQPASTITSELRAAHLSTAPWASVPAKDWVYACGFVQPSAGVAVPTTQCPDGRAVPDRRETRFLIDRAGRNTPNLLDPPSVPCS